MLEVQYEIYISYKQQGQFYHAQCMFKNVCLSSSNYILFCRIRVLFFDGFPFNNTAVTSSKAKFEIDLTLIKDLNKENIG